MAEAGGAIAINFDEESVLEKLNELTRGKGPEKCIDAVGLEAHVTRLIDSIYDRIKQGLMLEATVSTSSARCSMSAAPVAPSPFRAFMAVSATRSRWAP